MKKTLLLLAALLSISTSAMADESGMVRTAVETGTRNFSDGTDLNFTTWILADGFFKGQNWGNFQLGYIAKKGHNEDNDQDGFMAVELRPGYNKATSWGNFGGQLIFVQEKWSNSAKGNDAIKPEAWATYNLNSKSRIFTRALYSNNKITAVSDTDNWFEAEVQYKRDIAGGTLGTGVFVAPGVDEKDVNEARYLLNYAKFFPKYKIFTYSYGEFRTFDDDFYGNKWNAYKVGVYANHDLGNGFVVEAEVNRYSDFNYSWTTKEDFSELFTMAGVRYNF